MSSRGPYRRHTTPFKLQLCQDIRSGIIGRRDAQRTYSVSANLIQFWLTQFEPHRVCRRPFGLSYAAMTDASSMA